MVNIRKYKSLDSSNAKAKELAENNAPAGTVVIADTQTKGRGRLGRTFESPDNAGLYMSIILRPNLSEKGIMLITAAASVAITDSLKSMYDIDAEIKWVNDIYANGRKLCGILAEGIANVHTGKLEAIVLGIGINLKIPNGNYAESIKDIAISLEELAGTPSFSEMRDALALSIAENVLAYTASDEAVTSPSLLEEYRKRSCVIGKSVLVYKGAAAGKLSHEARTAKVLDIADNGGLSVIYTDGSREILTSGEITIRPL